VKWNIFLNTDKSGRVFFYAWLVFHIALIVCVIAAYFTFGSFRINADFFDIIPDNSKKEIRKAENALNRERSRSVVFLMASESFETAKESAASLFDKLSDTELFDNLSLYINNASFAEFKNFIDTYNYNLLGDAEITLLEAGGAQTIASDALEEAFSAFSFIDVDSIEKDPFLLSSKILMRRLDEILASGGAVSLYDDVLAVKKDDKWYILINGKLKDVSFNGGAKSVASIHEAIAETENLFPAAKCYYSGMAFHTAESSSNAQKEISIISTASIILIIILFLFIFRSPLPIILSVSASLMSIVFALLGALIFFREIHILTFVFGSAIIGTCIDYSIHYFVNLYRCGMEGQAARKKIFSAATMSFVSTEICFLAILCAPFSITKQFAVFSLFGMASSYLSVMGLFPLIKVSAASAAQCIVNRKSMLKIKQPLVKSWRFILFGAVMIFLIFFTSFNYKDISVKNNIRNLYSPTPELAKNEMTVSSVLDYQQAIWYFIVSGESAQAVLQKEERLRQLLDKKIENGDMRSYIATSSFIPSIEKQTKSYNAAAKLLPYAKNQFEAIGFPKEALLAFNADYSKRKDIYITPEDRLPSYIQNISSDFWLGNIDGKYYSSVMLFSPNVPLAGFKALAESIDGVYITDKINDIENELNSLTRFILLLFLCSYFIIMVAVKLLFPLKQTLKIAALPFAVCLVLLALQIIFHLQIDLFAVCAFVLVFGLGLDYIFYLVIPSNEKDNDSDSAIIALLLSYITTAVSFGALSFSSFVPVHIFGQTIFAGLTAALLSAMLLRGGR
jgi:predicted exporter